MLMLYPKKSFLPRRLVSMYKCRRVPEYQDGIWHMVYAYVLAKCVYKGASGPGPRIISKVLGTHARVSSACRIEA